MGVAVLARKVTPKIIIKHFLGIMVKQLNYGYHKHEMSNLALYTE